jgi:hypothetical protein
MPDDVYKCPFETCQLIQPRYNQNGSAETQISHFGQFHSIGLAKYGKYALVKGPAVCVWADTI